MLLKRLIVAAIGIPVIYICTVELPTVYFLVALSAISAMAQYEFYAMYKTSRTMSGLGIAGGVALLASSYMTAAGSWNSELMVLVAVSIAITSARLFMKRDPASALKDIAPAIVGVVYVPLLLIPMLQLRLIGYEWIIMLLVCVWTADTFAYFIGKNFGKRRLYIEISPNKTVAGAVGSVAGGVAASMVCGLLIIKDFGMPEFIIIGIALGSVTVVGDLVESMFKRDAGVKDSGSLMPGHGGMLDRVDGILFAAPTLYLLSMIL